MTELEARFERGIDLAQVRALLARAHEEAGAPASAVTALNLVSVHFSAEGSARMMEAATAAAAAHPARIVALVAEPGDVHPSASARVSLSRPRGSQLWLERIVLTARGRAVEDLESAMTGLLVPDAPLVVAWGGRPEGDLLRHAAETADRLIIDSGTRPAAALAGVARLIEAGAPLGDLAWARIHPWQALAAEVLDLPRLRKYRGALSAARVTAAQAPTAEAALLAGWFKSRVPRAEVALVSGGAGPSPSGALPRAPECPDGGVAELRFEAAGAVFALRREGNNLTAHLGSGAGAELLHRVRLPPEAPGQLLGAELSLLAGQDELYAAAGAEAARLVAAAGSA